MPTKIIIDSTSDVPAEIRDKFTVVPLTVTFGNDEYIDGVTIDRQGFYEKLETSEILPFTSQATPYAFEKALSETLENGDDAVIITVSSKLSGTYHSAVTAAAEYPGRVFAVDSKNVAIGTAILAEYALTLVEKGLRAEQIAWALTVKREKLRIIAMLDTLEYLSRGGRISKTAAIAGGILSIKPIVHLKDGEIVILGKARGTKMGFSAIGNEIASDDVDTSMPFMLGYTGTSDETLRRFKDDQSATLLTFDSPVRTAHVGSVVGTHAGPGAVAVAYFTK